MKKDRNTSAEVAELRRRAEARLRAAATKGATARTETDTQRLVHELQVHQIELEMQNEELRQSRAEVEAGLECYTELYDFAPVGYVTLGRDGTIRQMNLAGAHLLGVERARLPGLGVRGSDLLRSIENILETITLPDNMVETMFRFFLLAEINMLGLKLVFQCFDFSKSGPKFGRALFYLQFELVISFLQRLLKPACVR
jgi:hypothetical protein